MENVDSARHAIVNFNFVKTLWEAKTTVVCVFSIVNC